jgi:hypothetical protein
MIVKIDGEDIDIMSLNGQPIKVIYFNLVEFAGEVDLKFGFYKLTEEEKENV